jgi:AraC family transcriptional regulator of adaptative response/methylated-DNA-[protein]-cysteine methyltransferase
MTRDSDAVFIANIETPLGAMVAAATSTHLVLLEFEERPQVQAELDLIAVRLGTTCIRGESPIHTQLRVQFAEYFDGTRADFEIPLRTTGTPFQEQVWAALLKIPSGTTCSYASIAKAIGNPKSVRAVAGANGDNRIAILIPCHRVIGSDGTLTGYGGGLWRKRRLLDLESGVESML